MAESKAFLAEVAKTVAPVWRTVVSGLTRDQLVAGAEAKKRKISLWAHKLITKTVVTSGVTYHLVVIRGEEFAIDAELTYANVRAEGLRRGNRIPPADVAFLLAQFTQEELGHRRLVVMHDPISDSDGVPGVLGVDQGDDCQWVDAWYADPTARFRRGHVFVFLAPQGVEV